MRIVYTFFLAALLILPVSAQQRLRTMKRLPDTGQLQSFSSSTGEDGDVTIDPMVYRVEGGMVTDTVTGLIWQQTDGGEMTFAQARRYCDTLTLGGATDWRLPSGQELFSIQDLGRKNPALSDVFTLTQAEYWWSVDTLVGDATRVWCTNAGGGIGPHPTSETISAGGTKRFHVRAVRDASPPASIPSHFTDMGTDMVQDLATDRMWQQYCAELTLSWDDALAYADTLTLGGFTDWRLPNIKELHSIRENLERDPCFDLMYFPCMTSSKSLWSSTTMLDQTNDKAWIIQPTFGIVTYDRKTSLFGVICVRGGTTVTTSVANDIGEAIAPIAPNPTTGIVTIGSTPYRIDVYACDGRRVAGTDLGTSVDCSSVPSGIYYLVLSDGTRTLRTAIISKF